MKIIFVLLIGLGAVVSSYADDKAVAKYRNYTPEQIRDLPEKIRRSEVPMMYTFAAQRGLAVDKDLLFGMELNRLMYAGLHNYQAAIRAFQVDLGDKPTGVLTVWQIYNLEQRAQMQQLSRLLFPDSFGSFITDDIASVQGTVTILDDRIAHPINHVKVTCNKQAKECRVDQISLVLPTKTSWVQSYHVMFDTEYYEISRWDQETIDGSSQRPQNACRTTSVNFNFKTKEFYYVTRNAGGDCEFMGAKLDRLAKPRIAQIVDGEKIITDEFARIQRAAYEVLASEFRRQVDKASASQPAK